MNRLWHCLLRLLVLIAGPCTLVADETERPAPADYQSDWFLIHTDLPAEEAEALLERLETMLSILSRYWGAPPRKVIECYVVDDVNNWPESSLEPSYRAQVQRGGVTHARGIRRGRVVDLTAVVYATARFGTPQHEAVHAYCYHAFGLTGPTWYAEGMAEMGNYWQQGSSAVNCPDYVIDYLKSTQRPAIDEITAPDQQSGDGWRNYAWRWALCHFLVNNPNYSERFRSLGSTLLSGRGGSFEKAFASQREELEFEFDFFVEHLESGFDVARCRWDWKKSFREPHAARPVRVEIRADRGWQPSGIRLKSGQAFHVSCEGEWTVSDTEPLSAPSPDRDQPGALVGCLVHDSVRSASFPVSSDAPLIAPDNGELYLRCEDDWTSLSDNRGELSVSLQLQDTPAPADSGNTEQIPQQTTPES